MPVVNTFVIFVRVNGIVNKISEGLVSVSEIMAYLSQDRYLSLSETIKYTGLSDRTIRKYLPEIPHYRVGTKLLFRKYELDGWMLRYREYGEDTDLGEIANEALEGIIDPENNS